MASRSPEERLDELDAVFSALSHRARRQILMTLRFRGGAMSAGDIAGRFAHAWPTTTRHLRMLEDAQLVTHEQQGRSRIYRINDAKLAVIHEWLDWFEARDIAAETAEKTPEPTGLEQQLREIALRYPGAVEALPWGDRVVKVREKVFLSIRAVRGSSVVSVRLPLSSTTALQLPFVAPAGGGLDRQGWVTATFASGHAAPLDLLKQWIDESYCANSYESLSSAMEQAKKRP